MRILHISTYDSGGAGTAALRLHLGLLKSGVDSKFLCLHKISSHEQVFEHYHPHGASLLKKLLRKFGFTSSQVIRNQESIARLVGDYEFFSFPLTEYRLHEHPLVKEADVINLHWISNFLDFPSFFKFINKPIVWTLHDMNPFQGGFHYLSDKVKNQDLWKNIDLRLEQIKSDSLKLATDLAIVAPTMWLKEAASKSKVLGNFSSYNFAYGLDENVFKPLDKDFCCEVLNIPTERLNILFVAQSFQNYRKGFDLFLKAIEHVDFGNEFNIVTLGDINQQTLKSKFNFVNLGHISDPRLLCIAYNASDVLVLSSREDNLPNVMLESLACGVPVVSTPVGGMAETIKNGETGVVSKDISPKSLAEAIEDFLKEKDRYDKDKIRDFSVKNFSLSVQARKYIGLYKSLL